MIIHNFEQGSKDWLDIRLGKITASRFKDVLTSPKAKKDADKLSDTAYSYMLELIAEELTGKQKELYGAALEWGSEQEKHAREAYEFYSENKVDEVGFIEHECGIVGVSPDGLIGEDGGVEIKCPYDTKNHLRTVLSCEVPKEHIPQIQGCMWVSKRKWWDFISYDPRIEDQNIALFVKRVYRDEEYIQNMEEKVLKFAEKLKFTLEQLKENK